MPLAWNAWGLPFLLAAALQLGAALFIYFVGPRRLLNRALAVGLAFGASIQASYGLGAMATTEADAYAFAVIAQMSKFVIAPMYLVFLGAALATPLVRPFRVPAVRVALLGAAIVMPLVVVARPAWFVGARVERPAVAYDWASTPLAGVYEALAVVVFAYALVCSISAFRRAPPGTPARDRDRWFVLAFGTRDVSIGGFILLAAFVLRPGDATYDVAFNVVFAAAASASMLLLVYGVLKWHLFDLDLRLKWTLHRGTLAAIFLGVFIIVTEVAQNAFATRFGWAWGGVAAGLLLLALLPLQRLTQRLADAAMPGVEKTDEYLAHRRAEVYKGALQEILQDGTITPKERAILLALQTKLGLAPATAAALEHDAREALER